MRVLFPFLILWASVFIGDTLTSDSHYEPLNSTHGDATDTYLSYSRSYSSFSNRAKRAGNDENVRKVASHQQPLNKLIHSHMCYTGIMRGKRSFAMRTPSLGIFCAIQFFGKYDQSSDMLTDIWMIRVGLRTRGVSFDHGQVFHRYQFKTGSDKYKKNNYASVSFACFESGCNHFSLIENSLADQKRINNISYDFTLISSQFNNELKQQFPPQTLKNDHNSLNESDLKSFVSISKYTKCSSWALNTRYRGGSLHNFMISGGPCFIHLLRTDSFRYPEYMQTGALSYNLLSNPWKTHNHVCITQFIKDDKDSDLDETIVDCFVQINSNKTGINNIHGYIICYVTGEAKNNICNDQSFFMDTMMAYPSETIKTFLIEPMDFNWNVTEFDVHNLWESNSATTRTLFPNRQLFNADAAILSDTQCLTTNGPQLINVADIFGSFNYDISIGKTCTLEAHFNTTNFSGTMEMKSTNSTELPRGCHTIRPGNYICACHTVNCQLSYLHILTRAWTYAKKFEVLGQSGSCLKANSKFTNITQLLTVIDSASADKCRDKENWCGMSYNIIPQTGERHVLFKCVSNKEVNSRENDFCVDLAYLHNNQTYLRLACVCQNHEKIPCSLNMPYLELTNHLLLDDRLMHGKDTMLEHFHYYALNRIKKHEMTMKLKTKRLNDYKYYSIMIFAVFFPLTLLNIFGETMIKAALRRTFR